MKLNINNLIKKYGDRTVLNIDELIIEKGIITGIIGPNGCGKSTLMNIISGLDDKFTGSVKYDGERLNKSIIENMTYVFQKPYLFKRTVYENIFYPLIIRNVKASQGEKKVLDIIKRLEIENLTKKRADKLSGGESQKVALARALVFEPELLLLDEATSNIDPESIKIMEREILNFNKETGATIIIVTHSLGQAERLCDKILNLEHGSIVI